MGVSYTEVSNAVIANAKVEEELRNDRLCSGLTF